MLGMARVLGEAASARERGKNPVAPREECVVTL